MQQKFLLLYFLLFYCFSFSQGEANIWYFGTTAGLDFNNTPPIPLTNGVLSTSEGCAVISNATGNLLFYSDGGTVWSANHSVMQNGTGLMGNNSSAQSAVIIPKPGSTTNYYIITVPVSGGIGMRYSEVDMTLNGGLGAVLTTNKNTLMFAPSSEKVTAVKHSNGVFYWVVGRDNAGNRNYYSFLIDCNGINTTPIVSNVALTNGENWGYLVASPDGSKLASASAASGVEVTDFDNATGIVSNTVNLGTLNYAGNIGGNYGVAFSPNSNVLYATSITNWALVQWDLTATNIPASQTFIGYTNGSGAARPSYRGGALQLAPDGRIYVAEVGLSSVGIINDPNTVGLGCNFATSQIALAGRNCMLGLPPFVTSFFITESAINYTNDCITDIMDFSISGVTSLDSVRWFFGDPSSPSNTSNLFNPQHQYTSDGTFTVTLIRYIACIEDTITRDVIVHDYKRHTKYISLCAGETFVLPGGTSVNTPGTYNDTLPTTSLPACDSIITTIISNSLIPLSISNDTSICIGNSANLFANAPDVLEYNWDPDPTLSSTTIPNPIATPTLTTTYTVRATVRIGDNLVVNGDFENGNSDFTSEYIYVPDPVNGPGYYTVGPGVSNGWWPNCGDHTTGSGNALIADGANGTSGVAAASDIWCQTISVEPNTNYAFSSYQTNANSAGTTSMLSFSINGTPIGTPQPTSSTACEWNEFFVVWNSGNTTTATICLAETSGAQPGNDFAVDDITFYKLCEVIDSVQIVVSDPIAQIDSIKQVSCFEGNDGLAIASSTGGIEPYAYNWNSNPVQTTDTATNLIAGTYTVTITDSINCVATTTATITEPTVLTATILHENALCYGSSDGNAQVTANGGTVPYSYSWSTTPVETTDEATNLSAGNYTATVTDSNNCTVTVTVTILEPAELTLDFVDQTNVSCKNLSDGSAEVEAQGGTLPYSYSWDTTPIQTTTEAINLEAGNYTATVTDSNNCTATFNITITEPDSLILTLTTNDPLICPEASSTITAEAEGGTAPYNITWMGLPNQWSNTVTISETETFTATVTDAQQCVHTASITINVVELPVVNFSGTNLIGCIPLNVTLQNQSTGDIANCLWSFGDGTLLNGCGTMQAIVNTLGCQDVTLTVYTPEGCSNSFTANDYICTEPQPVADFSVLTTDLSTIATTVNFENHSQHATSYDWNFGDGAFSSSENPTHTFSDEMSGNYTVILIASNDLMCADTAMLTIKIKEEQLVFVPNTFTPDGDMFNQTFKPIIGSGVDIYHYRLSIYNRWGEFVFESRDLEIGWDGTYAGSMVPNGTYTWKIELKSKDNDDKKVLHGNVNLIR